MNTVLRNALIAAGLVASTQAAAQVVFYEHDGFQGRSFTAENSVQDFQRFGFNDRASSVVVMRERWEVCDDAGFRGRCVVLRPGRYDSLTALGLNDRVSSVRMISRNTHVNDDRFAPAPQPVYDNYRRKGEKTFEAQVTSVRAILGPPEKRCWVEHEQVAQGYNGANVGGVLVYQGGGRDGSRYANRDVQRCADVQGQKPDHWDVTYTFRGQEHHMQTAFAPGPTITVNGKGEPRA